ncbi:phage/plasmid replication protein [Mangrovibacterium marinum]|uniref:II/X family phage/plasmid replication protein n=1 Tax=Mangrovibacterium marinum TaxID=1639118 RepID=A0A2T5BYT5_9BACT|nr:phage/plasmid replication protein [Mangrovibacterium marinum]PTN07413.1 II/X family phage/plasmid replication protein [Mangrovibacterium marinum]
MIDSIVLRFHSLSQYPEIIQRLRKTGEGTNFYERSNPHKDDLVDSETGEVIDKDSYLRLSEIEYSDTGKVWTLYKNKVRTKSHYDLSYRVDMKQDFVEFNFSVPKYLFGTNLKQFIPHPNEKYHNFPIDLLRTMEFHLSNTFDWLTRFLNEFLLDWFDGIEIDKKDIEINRIDIAYNQIFNSKEDALQYLEFQKRIKKSYIRENSNYKADWSTSIFLSTERYGAKIYHKGSEYKGKNGDKSKHLRVNREKKETIFPVNDELDKDGNVLKEGLQSFADRILRYEITFRKSYMSYLFKKHLFANKCPFLKALHKEYKAVKKIKSKCEREIEKAQKGKQLTEKEKQIYMTAFISLPREKKDAFFQYEGILNKRNSFRLTITEEDVKGNSTIENIYFKTGYNPVIPVNALFSRELLHEMFKVFMSFMEEFQLKKLDKYEDNIQKVILYNREVDRLNASIEDPKQHKKRINETLANQILFNLQHHSLDEMVQLKLISRRTKYNYLKVLERLDISKNTILSRNLFESNEVDFTLYFDLLL